MGTIRKPSFFWIATGGTGGHIFPALAVADELIQRGHKVIVSTDVRGRKYLKKYKTVQVWASGVGAKKPIAKILSLFKIAISTVILIVRFAILRPEKIVAFGGYSSVPALIAGWALKIPTFLHEQNAAIGRANNFAMPFVKTLMTSFPIGFGTHTGLPVRKEFLGSINERRVEKAKNSDFRLLVTGGSLGAKVLDDVVPEALSTLNSKSATRGLFVVHQTRPENVEKLRKLYAGIGVKNNVLSFIKDMAGELSSASLVISRAGASTVAEMQAIGVAAIMVPLEINPDQMANAKEFAKNGGGIVMQQRDFTSQKLAIELKKLIANPDKLKKMAGLAYIPNDAIAKIMKIIDK